MSNELRLILIPGPIVDETEICGSCINVHNMIELVKRNEKRAYSHEDLKKIFSVNREILLSDLC